MCVYIEMVTRLGQIGVLHGVLEVQEHILEPHVVDSARAMVPSE